MRVAALQCEPECVGLDNALDRLRRALEQAREQGAQILVTPEMYLSGYNIGAEAVATAAKVTHERGLSAVSQLAQDYGLHILIGYPEVNNLGRPYNSAALFHRRGQLLSNYRKTHLFGDVDRAQFTAGESLSSVIELEGWRIALAICYDIEFPELARHYALSGAEAILIPTANMLPYDGVATRLVPARSEENSLYTAYANYCGAEDPFSYCGLSCICGADGADLARAGRGEEVIVAALSKQDLQKTRSAVTYLRDRRTDLYQAPPEGDEP